MAQVAIGCVAAAAAAVGGLLTQFLTRQDKGLVRAPEPPPDQITISRTLLTPERQLELEHYHEGKEGIAWLFLVAVRRRWAAM